MQITPQFSLSGRVALVTGSSRGLGRAMAMALGKAGAKVALNYRNNVETAERAFKAFQAAGHAGLLVRADVTDEPSVATMFSDIARHLGPVDILVINATCEQFQKPFEQYSWQDFQAMLDYFVKSPYLLIRACLPRMKEKRWGRIINIGSEVFQRGVPNFSAYVAAKGAQNGLARSLATELAPFGITVNTIAPGWIPVERHETAPQTAKDAYHALIPAARWGVPDDVAAATLFLASNEASFITGQNIAVNGGLTVC
jgi:3-oxoacyl-[acyl-carrier protein] reductase